MTAGDLYTIAGTATTCSDSADGGVASASTLSSAGMVMTDAAGNILVADASGIRVIAAATGTFYRQSMTAGDLYTVAPVAKGGFTVDGAGNLVVASTLDDSISVLAETTGTFYGVPMTAGQTYQIGGDGFLGHAGDGGPATNATLTQPVSVLATSDGGIVDAEYHWLREIAG